MAKKTKPGRTLPYYFPEPPVQPRPERLPLHDPNWTWGQFEAFCRDLVRHQPGVLCSHHYGKAGSRQRGIDLYADFQNEVRWTFQCKQRREFKRADVEKAIAKNSYTAARHIILVSTELGSEARDACGRHPGWEVWDVRDISAKVRELQSTDPDAARRIVEDHFGRQWRGAFLGITGLSTYLSPYDFFQKFLDPKHVFNHTFSLVGRGEQSARLDEFVSSDRHRVVLVRGRGGIGKTKLLHAFSQGFGQRHPGFVLRFVPDGVPITSESSDELAATPLVVVVDDAHRRDREELGVLFAIARQREHPLKLILSLRASGYDAVYSRLIHADFDTTQIAPLVELGELSQQEVKGLASQVLGKSHARLVDRLTEATRDCPLVTVIGGRLLVERAVAPELLERQADFQEAVLSKFGDEILGKVSDQIDPAFCLRLMRLIAAVMPFDPSDCSSVRAAAEFLGADQAAVVEAIGHLEATEVVYRAGRSLRITPDVLADHILHKACLTLQGRQTGYIPAVFREFGGICPAQLLRNLAELDWRVNRTSGGSPVDLLEEVWGDVMREFATAEAHGRVRILDVLTDFSYYQPRRILDIAEFAMKNPTGEVGDRGRPYQLGHLDVLDKLPALLRRVCYSPEWLPRACELLWQLGRDDDRPTNPHPDHPLRVLADLAGYDRDKPVYFNAALFGCVERWAGSSDAARHVGKLCDILDPLLEKTGHTSYADGVKVTMEAFHVSEPNTRQVRDRVIALLERLLSCDDPRVPLRAAKSFGKALNNPMSLFNMKIGTDQCQVWAPEQLRILDILERFMSKRRFAIATLSALGSVRWTARYNLNSDVKSRARRLGDSVVPDFDMQLTELLWGDYQSLVTDVDFDGDVTTSLARREARQQETSRSLAKQVVERWPDPSDGLDVLSRCLDLVLLDDRVTKPATFLLAIGEVSLDYLHGLCEAIIETPERSLARYLDVLVTPIRLAEPKWGLDLLGRALDSRNPVLWQGVASFYYHAGWVESVCDEDVLLIERLLKGPNLNARGMAIGALWNLGKARPHAAKGLALSVELEGNDSLAEELFMRLEMGTGVPLEGFEDDEIDELIGKLAGVKTVDGYWINQFLVYGSRRRPLSVLRMLLHRLDTFGWSAVREAHAFPILGFDKKLEGLPEHPAYPDMLREVRDRMLAPQRQYGFLVPQLFREITLNFSTDCLSVLDEWVETRERDKVEAVASLLKESTPDFVFTQTEFVGKLLGVAHAIGDECFRTVVGFLRAPPITEGRQGVPGVPFPQDLALKEKAAAAARSWQTGSPQWRFYDSLARHAEDSIRESLLRDAELG
jgi:hypothetical protein